MKIKKRKGIKIKNLIKEKLLVKKRIKNYFIKKVEQSSTAGFNFKKLKLKIITPLHKNSKNYYLRFFI